MRDGTPRDLARFWDRRTARTLGEATDLDPSLVKVVDRFGEATDDVPDPDTTFVNHLWEDLMNAQSTTLSSSRPTSWRQDESERGMRSTPWSLAPALPLPRPAARWLPALVAAALLLVTLGIAGYAILDRNGSTGRGGPAIYAPATPSPEAESTEETLMEIQIPANMLPTGRDISAGLVGLAIPVGTSSTWTPICCTGPLVEYVVSGTYTVRAQEPITVVRADGTVEAIGADTAVTLGPGDGLLSHNENVVEASNSGTTPVDLLQWVMIDDTAKFNEHKPSGWVRTGGPNIQRSLTPSDSPMVITLRRVTAENGAKIAAPDGGSSVQFAIPADPDTGLIGNSSDGSIVVYGEADTPVTVYILTATQGGGEGGTPAS